MKRLFALSLVAAAAVSAAWPDSLDITGQINLQAQKFTGPSNNATQETSNNLDQWFGEAVLGLHYQEGKVSSEIELTMYPVGFGISPREVTYYPDGSGQKSATKDSLGDQIVLSQAWFGYALPFGGIDLKLGRFSTDISQGTGMYGNYVDQDPDGGFLSRGATHNALEMSMLMNKFYLSLMAQSTDDHLNTGRIRAQISYYAPKWGIDMAFRNNVLDKFRGSNDSKSQTRLDAGTYYLIATDFKVYGEAGLIAQEQQDNGVDKIKAFLVGVTIPTGKVLDNLAIECEYSPNRETAGEDPGTVVESPVLFNLQLTKAISSATLVDVAIFSDPMGADYADIGIAGRLQANLW